MEDNSSYILGNSWSLNLIHKDNLRKIDDCEDVYVTNYFPRYYQRLNARPSVWIWGATSEIKFYHILQNLINDIDKDSYLTEKLHTLMIPVSHPVFKDIKSSKLRIVYYNRYKHDDENQIIANSLNDTVFHYGNVLSDAINIAHIDNPKNKIKILGCPYSRFFQYFYENKSKGWTEESNEKFVNVQWDGFKQMMNQGVNIIDCNNICESNTTYNIPTGEI